MHKKGIAFQTYVILGIIAVALSAFIFIVISYSSYRAPLEPTVPGNDTITEPPVVTPIDTTTQTHLACISNRCTVVQGVGSNLNGCTTVNAACTTGTGGGGGGGGGSGGGGGGGGGGGSCTATVPVAPSGLSITMSSTNFVSLVWSDNSGNEDSMVVERSRDNFVTIESSTTLGANALFYNDTQIISGTYYYRVKATNCAGSSSYSNIVVYAPPVCGDKILSSGEQCDDGNLNTLDGCSATCQIESIPPVAGNICNPGQLNYIRTALGGTYRLTCDIDLENYNFQPIGDVFAGNVFTGTLNGQNHTISNFHYVNNTANYAGLFEYIGSQATISDLVLSDVLVRGIYAGGIAGTSVGTLNNIFVNGTVFGYNSSGLLMGSGTGTLTRIKAKGSVTINNSGYYGGGITGSFGPQGSMDRVSYEGTIFSPSSAGNLGGLTGLSGLGSVTISNSYAKATILGGNVRGGLIGLFGGTTLSNSYAVSNLGTGLGRGGLIGVAQNGVITNSYWDVDTSGVTQSSAGGPIAGATGLRNWQMNNRAKYTGFDFNSIWNIDNGCTNPWLRFESTQNRACDASTLQLSYPLSEVGTNLLTPDISIYERNGAILNTQIAFQPLLGNVTHFNSGGAIYTNADIDLGGSFTLMGWIKMDSLPQDNNADSYRIIDKSQNGSHYASYSLLINRSGSLIGRTHSQDIATGFDVVSPQPLSTNVWYPVALVSSDPGGSSPLSMDLYVNAMKVATLGNIDNGPYDGADNVVIGSQFSSGSIPFINNFRGYMYDVRIYNRSLKGSEIFQIQGTVLTGLNVTSLDSRRPLGSPAESFWSNKLVFILWLHLLLLIILVILLIIAVVVKRRKHDNGTFVSDDRPKSLPPYSPQPAQSIPQVQRQVIPVASQPAMRPSVVAQVQRPQQRLQDDRSHFLT